MDAEPILEEWIGCTQTQSDLLAPGPARLMQATLDRKPDLETGAPLPPLWHWLYFLSARPASALGRDGHPRKGGFLPPSPLPRRMWAGGRLTFHKPLVLGMTAKKSSTILDVTEKLGRTGALCFVTVRHEITCQGALMLTEEQDIVYREDPKPGDARTQPPSCPAAAQWSETVAPDPTTLFRYSALTFNGHRIHYDVDYAREVEGYAGLVFHGPLTATLLVDLAARKRGSVPTQFSFRGHAPLAGAAPFYIEGNGQNSVTQLWARRDDWAMSMQAEAIFEDGSLYHHGTMTSAQSQPAK